MNDPERRPGIALAKIEALQTRFESEDHAADVTLDSYRDLLHAAHNSSNGSAHLVPALSETVGLLAVVLAQEKLREPERLRKAFLTAHGSVCPVMPLIGKKPDGTPLYPWEKEADAKPEASLSLSFRDGLKATGMPAKIAVVLVVVAGVLYGLMWLNEHSIKAAVSGAIRQQLTAAQDTEG